MKVNFSLEKKNTGNIQGTQSNWRNLWREVMAAVRGTVYLMNLHKINEPTQNLPKKVCPDDHNPRLGQKGETFHSGRESNKDRQRLYSRERLSLYPVTLSSTLNQFHPSAPVSG